MTLIEIEGPDDRRIAGYSNIRDRDLARRDGLFIAEGKVVLRQLFDCGRFEPVSMLVLENRLAGLEDILADAPADLPVYVARAEIIDAIAGFHLHRGVLALVKRREPESVGDVIAGLPDTALILALVGISNHDNAGGIFRNAAAFGVNAVLLDATCCDPLYRKAVRVSVGGVLKVPYAMASNWREMVSELGNAGFSQFALTPGGNLDIRDVESGARAALYLGAEGEGLPPELIASMQGVRISIGSGFDSLNVAATSAIALHRFSKMAG